MKGIKSNIKQNIQGINSGRNETKTQNTNLEQKEDINIWLEQNEEIRIWKNEDRLRYLWHNFKCSNILIIGVPEGEEEEHEMDNF